MSLAKEIRARVAALRDRSVPSLRALRREYSQRLRSASGREVLDLALEIADERLIAYELIAHHREARSLLTERLLKRLAGELAAWDHVDMFAVFLSGPAWREGLIGDEVIAKWARLHDRWWRRAALVSTIRKGDPQRTLAICLMLIDDRDDMVVKAMSWALRELSKHDAAAVRAFVDRHEERLAARVIREVRNKLTTGLKVPRSSPTAGASARTRAR